jgi:hypothetical protein
MSEKAKYNYYDYQDSKKKLPADINQICIDTLNGIDPSGKMADFFRKKEEKRLFGVMNVIHPKTLRLIAVFEMHSGIVKMFKLIEYLDSETVTHFLRTIINKNVTFEKKGVKNGKKAIQEN